MDFTIRKTISEILLIVLFLSHTFSFDVNLIHEPKDKIILEEKTAEFWCIFSTWKQGLTCIWKHNNNTLQHQISKHKVTFNQHKDTCTLEIPEVTLSDSGQYSCHVINSTDTILKSSKPATLSVVPFPTPTCQSNQESYMVGDVLILYCIAQIIDGVSTHPSKLEWSSSVSVLQTIELTNNGTHIISQNKLLVTELNEYSFVCRLNVNLKNEENNFCKKSIHVNINVTIFTSDYLQVGQYSVFQCNTGHDCLLQCEYNWTINNTNLLVNISESKLNLTITDEMIDSILMCHVKYSNQVHGFGTYVISGSTLGTTIDSAVSNESCSKHQTYEKKNGQISTKTVLTLSLIIYLLIIILSSYGICMYKRSKEKSNHLLYNRNLNAYRTRLAAFPINNTSEQHSHHNSDASIASYAVIPDTNSATTEPETQRFVTTEHYSSVNAALTTFAPGSTPCATRHNRPTKCKKTPLKAQSLVDLPHLDSMNMDHLAVNSMNTNSPFYFTLTENQPFASSKVSKPEPESCEDDRRFYFTLNQEH